MDTVRRVRLVGCAMLLATAGSAGCFHCGEGAHVPASGAVDGSVEDAGTGTGPRDAAAADAGDACFDGCNDEALPTCGDGMLDPGEVCDTTPACDPDCVYSCSDPACLGPILDVTAFPFASPAGDPQVAHGPSDGWVVAWTDSSPAPVPAVLFAGDMPLVTTANLGGCPDVASAQLVATVDRYVFVYVENGQVRFRAFDFSLVFTSALEASNFLDASLVVAVARPDGYETWMLFVRPDLTYGLWGGSPPSTLAGSAPGPTGPTRDDRPAVALHANSLMTIAYVDASSGANVPVMELSAGGSSLVNGVTGTVGPFPYDTGTAAPRLLALQALAAGAYVAVWNDDSSAALRVRYYAADGVPTDVALDLGVGMVPSGYAPDVAGDALGNHVIVWTEDDGACTRIRALVLNADGTPYVTPFASDDQPFIVSGVDCTAQSPSVAVGPAGEVVVAWRATPDPVARTPDRVRARRFPGLLPP
jgi:hypothetical protein